MYAPHFTVNHIRYMRRILKDNARIIRIIGHFRRMNSNIFRLPLPLDFSVPGRCSKKTNYTVKRYKARLVTVIIDTDGLTVSDCKL